MKLRCSRCGAEIEQEDAYDIREGKVCEDCYLDEQMVADRFSETFGSTGPEEVLEE